MQVGVSPCPMTCGDAGSMTIHYAASNALAFGLFSASILSLCPPGTYSTSGLLHNGSCTVCNADPGHVCPAGSTNSTGAPCPPGRFSSGGVAAGDCTECPAGTFGSSWGLSNAGCSGVCRASPGKHCTSAGTTSPSGQDSWYLFNARFVRNCPVDSL